jgi:hypothetical protein
MMKNLQKISRMIFIPLGCYGMDDWVPYFPRLVEGRHWRKRKRYKNRHAKAQGQLNKKKGFV